VNISPLFVLPKNFPLNPRALPWASIFRPGGAPDNRSTSSLEELARRQGVSLPQPSEEMLGGWPEDELDDGFEDEVASWRKRELEQTQ